MKITARITGTADLARLDVTRLRDRLVAALERDLQAPDRARDTEVRHRFASPLRGEVGTPRT